MLYQFFWNGKVIDNSFFFNKSLSNTFGIGKIFVKIIEQRAEKELDFYISDLNKVSLDFYTDLLYSVVPFNSSIKNRIIFNIYILDLLTIYRGWRHYKGLPVRGQRTWSNAWSVYRNNKILRDLKIKKSKIYYNNVPSKEAYIAYTAEYVNLFWKNQWPIEWSLARKHLLRYDGHPGSMKIDLYSMSNYQVTHPLKLQNMSKKQKKSLNKNYFSLGFEPGFTKPLLNSIFDKENTTKNDKKDGLSSSKLVLRDERLNKKNKKNFKKNKKK